MILTELRAKNPTNQKGQRSKKHHQFLSDDLGITILKNHLVGLEALAKASDYNWDKFMLMVDKVYPKQYQKLKTGLEYNSKEEKILGLFFISTCVNLSIVA